MLHLTRFVTGLSCFDGYIARRLRLRRVVFHQAQEQLTASPLLLFF